MIRTLLLAVLAVAGAFVGEFGWREAALYSQSRATTTAARATEARKTREINVPRIKNGGIKGYAVMILSYTVDLSAQKAAEMAPDAILVDEAFRYVYNDDTIDFDHLDRFDFSGMSKALIRSVNARVKGDVLVDVGVQEFTYQRFDDTHARPGQAP